MCLHTVTSFFLKSDASESALLLANWGKCASKVFLRPSEDSLTKLTKVVSPQRLLSTQTRDVAQFCSASPPIKSVMAFMEEAIAGG